MKVYQDEDGQKRLIGRAEIPENAGPVYQVALFGAASTIMDHFTIGTVTHLPQGQNEPVVERAVIVEQGQYPDVLPGWQPLSS